MNKNIRLSGIAYESLVNGPGMRRVFFSQGCKHNCKGCFNPETHDFNGGEEKNMDELIKDVLEEPFLKGVTFSGGDPFEQADKFAYMAKKFKENGLNVWSYTGYTYEYLIANANAENGYMELLSQLDYLVDGPFILSQRSLELKFMGSKNQRFIDVQRSLKEGRAVVVEPY